MTVYDVPRQFDRDRYDEMRQTFSNRFATMTRDAWIAVFAGTDACVTPVLTRTEAAGSEHLLGRGALLQVDGVVQAATAPRFSRSAPGPPGPPPQATTPVDELGW